MQIGVKQRHIETVNLATFGFERGIWFQVREGLRGLLVRDGAGQPHVYLLTQPASHCGMVSVRPGMTLKAVAYKSGMADSSIAEVTYPEIMRD